MNFYRYYDYEYNKRKENKYPLHIDRKQKCNTQKHTYHVHNIHQVGHMWCEKITQ